MFNTPLEIFSFIFGWIATIITVACYLPQTIKTIITKDTAALSKWFFILGFSSSLAWVIGGFVSIFVYLDQGNSINEALLISLPVIVTNIIGIISNLIVLVIKLKNIKKAKQENITEKEYCQRNSKDDKSIVSNL